MRVPLGAVIGFALAALVLGACAGDTSLGDLDGTYQSTANTGHELVDDTFVELVFDGEQLSAWAGCNRLGAGFSLEGDLLVTGEFLSTRMACEPELMDQDVWLVDFLGSRPRLSLDRELVISGSSGGSAVELRLAEVADGSADLD